MMAHLKTAILIIDVLNLASCISGAFLCRCEALKWPKEECVQAVFVF